MDGCVGGWGLAESDRLRTSSDKISAYRIDWQAE
jgi:hypothetical protein